MLGLSDFGHLLFFIMLVFFPFWVHRSDEPVPFRCNRCHFGGLRLFLGVSMAPVSLPALQSVDLWGKSD